jgi:hypothetical protein
MKLTELRDMPVVPKLALQELQQRSTCIRRGGTAHAEFFHQSTARLGFRASFLGQLPLPVPFPPKEDSAGLASSQDGLLFVDLL